VQEDTFILGHIHPDDRGPVNAAVQRSLAGDNDGRYDMRYRVIGATDGKMRWVHFNGRAYFNDKGLAMAIGLLRGRDMVVELGNDAIFQVWGKTRDIIGKDLLDALPRRRHRLSHGTRQFRRTERQTFVADDKSPHGLKGGLLF
jgi:hypothetical protein